MPDQESSQHKNNKPLNHNRCSKCYTFSWTITVFCFLFVVRNLVSTSLDDRFYQIINEDLDFTWMSPVLATTTSNDDSSNTIIRRWGCAKIMQTPLIFVHIGKAGGGNVRMRFAAAAQNVSRSHLEWHSPQNDNHSYHSETKIRFCNSGWNHHHIELSKPHGYDKLLAKFEGVQPCNATTPLGQMVACPQPHQDDRIRCQECHIDNDACHSVYVGHNVLGSEIHWLPPKVLQQWWDDVTTTSTRNRNFLLKTLDQEFVDSFRKDLSHLSPGNRRWCRSLKEPRPTMKHMWLSNHEGMKNCSYKMASRIDAEFHDVWLTQTSNNNKKIRNYAPIYASLPVHRVTILREPFSWLHSKFFWQKQQDINDCDDVASASQTRTMENNFTDTVGWAYECVLGFVLYLCGVDCTSRYEHGLLSMEELEAQATDNLRQSFTVVGLLNETEEFYNMLDQRFEYLEMTANPHFVGNQHTSRKGQHLDYDEYDRCQELYLRNETFRNSFKQELPLLATMERLYELGVKVNRFQQNEMKECNS